MKLKTSGFIFFIILCALWLTAVLMSRGLLYPFVTSKGFYLRAMVELALPFYFYLILVRADLRPNLKQPLNLAVLAFLLVNIISSFLGESAIKSLWGNFERMGGSVNLAHLSLIYFYVLMLGRLSNVYLKRLLLVGVYSGGLISLYAIAVRLKIMDFYTEEAFPRMSSTFGNPIFFASFIILPLFLAAFFALSEENRNLKRVYWILAALQAVGIFLSGTRGAVVGVAGGTLLASVIALVLEKNRKIKIWAGGTLLALAAFLGVLFVFNQKFPQGSIFRRVFNLNDSNAQSRLVQWRVGIQGVKDAPWFGTGPENYNIISNKYYDPQMVKYDAAWFDKPHNYLLEILTTTGIFGLFAYLAALAFSFWAIWRAYKLDLVSLWQGAALWAGLIAYQAQNLFVFDTVSASLAFFVYTGFLGFLWSETAENQATAKNIKQVSSPLPWQRFAFWAFLAFMFFVNYAANYMGVKISKTLNYGHAYGLVSPKTAVGYFDQVKNLPFNVYVQEWGYELSKFALSLNEEKQQKFQLTPEFAAGLQDEAISLEERVKEKYGTEPFVWMQLANLYQRRSVADKAFEAKALAYVDKAIALAPKRPEPRFLRVQILIQQEKMNEAKNSLESFLEVYPEHFDARWQLANIYYILGDKARGAEIAEKVLLEGRRLEPVGKMDWLIVYFTDANQADRLVAILELQAKVSNEDPDVFVRLADAYKKTGQKQKAIAAARMVEQLDPSAKAEVEAFIRTLQ